MSLSQKDAVYKAVTAHRQADGSFDRKAVVDELSKMFRAGEFVHGNPDTLRDDKVLRDYCGQILSNWLRKDDRLGGSAPAASRAGRKKVRPADDELKNLLKAKVVLSSTGQDTQEIDQKIEERTQQIESEKAEVADRTVQDALDLLSAVEETK